MNRDELLVPGQGASDVYLESDILVLLAISLNVSAQSIDKLLHENQFWSWYSPLNGKKCILPTCTDIL